MSDSCSPSRGRSRSPSPARGRSPQRRAEQDSERTQVVGRKGNNKGKGKGKGQNAGWSDESSLPREVKFAEDDPGGQLLACLKALILECEVQGTKNLLPKLKTLVQGGTGVTHTKDGCSPLSSVRYFGRLVVVAEAPGPTRSLLAPLGSRYKHLRMPSLSVLNRLSLGSSTRFGGRGKSLPLRSLLRQLTWARCLKLT